MIRVEAVWYGSRGGRWSWGGGRLFLRASDVPLDFAGVLDAIFHTLNFATECLKLQDKEVLLGICKTTCTSRSSYESEDLGTSAGSI